MHIQSVLHPAGVEAGIVSHLWWVMFWTCAVVWVAVAGGMLLALRRGRARTAPGSERVLFSLWWLEMTGELTRAEVATALGTSVAHAGVRIQRMREQLEASRQSG